jgi:protein TonB
VKPTPAPAVPTIVAPTKVALSLPSVELKTAPIAEVAIAVAEPARSAAVTSSGRASDDDAAGSSKGGLSSGSSGKAYDENQVDRTVEVSRAINPIYPAALRSVNVEGAVVMSFIVGADGRVEPNSIKVVSTPHRLFGDAVRTALLSTRYRAAEANGQKVRQLVEQSFTFKLDKQ